MADPTNDAQLDPEFFEIRKPGAHLEEGVVADDFVIMLGVDLNNFPSSRGSTTTSRTRRPTSTSASRLDVDSGAELPDYSGPVPPRPALHRLLQGSARQQVPAVERGVPPTRRRRVGRRGARPVRRRDDGRDRVGRVERPSRPRTRAHAERVPPRRHRLRRPERDGPPKPTEPGRASSTPDCSRRART